MDTLINRIAHELSVQAAQVQAAVTLLDAGATVPFISRYRKEVTGGLDDTQLRNLEERLLYLRELDDRRNTILKSIADQGKLTPELETQIVTADNKARLEDLYLPYKSRRVTKGKLAIEAGLLPLADLLINQPELNPEEQALPYLQPDKGYVDVKTVLEGVRHILMERFSEDATLISILRSTLQEQGLLRSQVMDGKQEPGQKFRDYFDHTSSLKDLPSHRALALFRGRNEGILSLGINLPQSDQAERHPGEVLMAQHVGIEDLGRAADRWLLEVVRWAWRVKLQPHLETELLSDIKACADLDAIQVFARNLKDLLLAAPAGMRATLGLDPGLRTGVKVAVVDATGKLVDHGVIFPHEPRKDWDGSLAILAGLCQQHHVQLIAIGNGTASRETDRLATELMRQHPELQLTRIVVSEAGASVYSASELAAREFPDLDVSYRGAVSIARRLQDPLAELVKIDPKSIGVGQYQHDVNQGRLARSLDAVVEDCVSHVGVDVNTASAALLARIAGLNPVIANNIVSFRDQYGAFKTREQLKQVPRLGDRTFEQAAGFLRISQGDHPLDASSVHPESYPLVEKILQATSRDLRQVIGDVTFLRAVNAAEYTDNRFGLPTVTDILSELEKPGRDPRPEFKAPQFLEGIDNIKHLKVGMKMEGVITNVTNFGAFVDIGVHQDGLVHISALTDRFIKDPHEVVKAGDIVQVRVLDIDLPRSRIALTMRKEAVATPPAKPEKPRTSPTPRATKSLTPPPPRGATLGDLLRKAGIDKR
ncbi:MAG: RNA-binding transcriptional accessory protein [Pseudomonadales bacterium]|nr:RNA-binding transcriptional accessory protein [Pseudomonadales bacterium]